MIFFHGLRLYRLAAAEADMSYTPPFGGAIFFSMVRMIELLQVKNEVTILIATSFSNMLSVIYFAAL